MDQHRLDSLTHSLTSVPSRRDVLRGLAGAGLAVAVVAGGSPQAAARKKRKRRKGKQPRVRRNAFGCVDVGKYCQTDGQCCSNLCQEGQCRAHDTGGCPPGALDGTCGGTSIGCATTSGDDGFCNTTTGNAGFCTASGGCHRCAKDVECQAIMGAGAACIHCTTCPHTGGTSCAAA